MKHLIQYTLVRYLIVKGEDPALCLQYAKDEASVDDWTTESHGFTATPTCGKFTLGEGQNREGAMVPAWGFNFGDFFVVDAKASNRGPEEPAYYGLTQEEVDELDRLNADRGLL